jgi:hypothetical protein
LQGAPAPWTTIAGGKDDRIDTPYHSGGNAAVVGSAGSTSTQAAAPPAGKQAPGFYRYKVGSHEVTVLTDGARSFALTESYVTNAPIAEVRKALVEAYLPPDKMIHHYAPIVIQHRREAHPRRHRQRSRRLQADQRRARPTTAEPCGCRHQDDRHRHGPDLAFPRRSRERPFG